MKNILVILSLMLFAAPAFSQESSPVKWTFGAEKAGDEEYLLTFTALVDNGWYIYSQHLDEGGPIPTSFELKPGVHFELQGETEESGPNRLEGFDELFSMNVVKYGKRAVFQQRVLVTDVSQPIEGSLTFMVCDDEQCLPPKTVRFSIPLGN